MRGIEHTVVIVGYSTAGGSQKVYINDPSGALVHDEFGVGELPYIAVELDWNELTPYINFMSYLIAVGGTPRPPKGPIDVHDYGVRFWHTITQWPLETYSSYDGLADVYSWLYGDDKGLIWERAPWHPLALDSRDYF